MADDPQAEESRQAMRSIVEEMHQFGRDLRSHVSGAVEPANWSMFDKDLAAEQRGEVDYHLARAIAADNFAAMIARGGSLPRLQRQAQHAIAREEERDYGRSL